jgi:hypothetical protein
LTAHVWSFQQITTYLTGAFQAMDFHTTDPSAVLTE